MPVIGVLNLLNHVAMLPPAAPGTLVVGDLALLLSIGAVLQLVRRTSLWTDVLLNALAVFYFVFFELLLLYAQPGGFAAGVAAFEGASEVALAAELVGVVGVGVVMALLGTHLLACLIGIMSLFVASMPLLGCGLQMFLRIITSVILLSFAAVLERALCTAYFQCQSLERLVVHGSDGYCVVHLGDGTILEACPRFPMLFTSPLDSLQSQALSLPSGTKFTDLVAESDHHIWDEVIESARRGDFAPSLVTFRLLAVDGEFDVRLVPYHASRQCLHLCVQVQGETRSLDEDLSFSVAVSTHTVADSLRYSADSYHGSARYAHLVRQSTDNNMEVSVQTSSSLCCRKDIGTQTGDYYRRRPPMPPPQRGSPASTQRVVVLTSKKRVLPTFRSTPRATIRTAACWAMAHINPHGVGCCSKHICAGALRQLLRQIAQEACHTGFSPHTGWQCEHCKAMNESVAADSDFEDEEVGSGASGRCTGQLQVCAVCELESITVNSPRGRTSSSSQCGESSCVD